MYASCIGREKLNKDKYSKIKQINLEEEIDSRADLQEKREFSFSKERK